MLAHIIAITNQKGGVGKTTTAVNVSACLAESGKRTLLVDLDPQGNATSGLGVDKASLETNLYDCLIEGRPMAVSYTHLGYSLFPDMLPGFHPHWPAGTP